MLATFGIPKDLLARFDRYETQDNSRHEELRELAQEVAALRAENNSLRRFCSDRLFNIYENLAARDVETSQAFRTILELHRNEYQLNQNVRDAINRNEALLGQPLSNFSNPADAVLSSHAVPPPSPPPNDHGSNTAGPSADLLSIQAPTKRDTSSRPEDVENPAKRPKL